jgi:neopullulanase
MKISVKASELRIVVTRLAAICALGVLASMVALAPPAPARHRLLAANHAAPRPTSPTIAKVEPPNWWVGLKPDPMLLITGEGLEGARVVVSYRGVEIQRTKPSPGGRYIFAWLKISTGARPGTVPIVVRSPSGGETEYRFPLLTQPAKAGSFQGVNSDDVIYLIMPDRFADGDTTNDQPAQSPGTYDRSKPRAYHGGDLRGIREHLDYLRNLGVTAIWINPIYDNDNSSPQDYHGYGAVDFYAVNEHFGTLQDFQDLVNAAHAKGLKVILDVVPNHTGPRHPWVNAPPEPDWFHGTKEHHLTSSGPFENLIDPHAPPKLWRALVEGWFAGVLPDLNQENPEVEQYLIENGLWWAQETGLDGYRLDTFPYVSRRFWSEWHRAQFRAYPHFFTVGEVFYPDPAVTSYFVGGREVEGIDSGVTTVFDFPFYFALRDVILRDAPMQRIISILQRDWLYPRPDSLVTFLGNHDVRRFLSERGSSKEKLKLAFSLLLTIRGIPQLYYGDEIGMQGGDDPDNRRDFPGGVPGDPRNAFDVSGRTADEQEIFAHVQRLLALRREHPALRRGRLWEIDSDNRSYTFARVADQERLLMVMNNADEPRSIRLSFADTPLAGCRGLVALQGGRDEAVQSDQVELKVPSRQLFIYQVK